MKWSTSVLWLILLRPSAFLFQINALSQIICFTWFSSFDLILSEEIACHTGLIFAFTPRVLLLFFKHRNYTISTKRGKVQRHCVARTELSSSCYKIWSPFPGKNESKLIYSSIRVWSPIIRDHLVSSLSESQGICVSPVNETSKSLILFYPVIYYSFYISLIHMKLW